jgi:hypothetical protein
MKPLAEICLVEVSFKLGLIFMYIIILFYYNIMSIAVLKRKTLNGNPRLAPISGSNNGSFGFSLNGTRRNVGRVGVTNLAPGAQTGPTQMIASMPGHITNNNGIRGHPTSCCTNDENVVKPSVINTRGMLSRRLNCLPPQPEWRTCTNCTQGTNPKTGCYNWVQSIDSGLLKSHTQEQYIIEQATRAICDTSANTILTWPCVEGSACYASCPFPVMETLSSAEKNRLGLCQSQFIGTKKVFRGPYTKVLPSNASQSSGAALSQSEYLRGRYLSKQCIPPNIKNQHFPLNINNSGCSKYYTDKAEAVADGLYNDK